MIVIAYISVGGGEVLFFLKRRFQIADIIRNCQEDKLFFMNDINKSKKFY